MYFRRDEPNVRLDEDEPGEPEPGETETMEDTEDPPFSDEE